jgi:hypothetical protein
MLHKAAAARTIIAFCNMTGLSALDLGVGKLAMEIALKHWAGRSPEKTDPRVFGAEPLTFVNEFCSSRQ